jgi:type VI secretion system protein ImpA
MASPPVIKIAELVTPITGAEDNNPAGAPMAFAVEQELDTARKDYEQGATGNRVPKKADWDLVIKLTSEHLKEKSKDLRLAIRLAEGVTKKYGVAGLRDSLVLFRTLIDQCWDRIFPVPNPEEGEDMTIRGELLSDSLSDPDAGFAFPHTIRNIPVVEFDNEQFSLQDKQQAERGKGSKPKESFGRAKPINEHLLEDWQQASAEVKQLRQVLDKKLDGKGPSFQKLEDAVDECLFYVKNVAPEQAPAKEEAKAADNGQPGQAAKGASGTAAAVTSREEAYRQISMIANTLEKLEPHSPIPDLLRRTVELGKMPFRELIREIVREDKMIKEIYREYGIEEKKEEKKAPEKK